jgi:hypothetical protein
MSNPYSKWPRRQPRPISGVILRPRKKPAVQICASAKELVFSSPVAPPVQIPMSQFAVNAAGNGRSCALAKALTSSRIRPALNLRDPAPGCDHHIVRLKATAPRLESTGIPLGGTIRPRLIVKVMYTIIGHNCVLITNRRSLRAALCCCRRKLDEGVFGEREKDRHPLLAVVKAWASPQPGLEHSSPRLQIVFPVVLAAARPRLPASTARGLAIARSYATAGMESVPGSNS